MSILIAYLIIGAMHSLGLFFDHYRKTDIKDMIYTILVLILFALVWPLVLYTTRHGTRK